MRPHHSPMRQEGTVGSHWQPCSMSAGESEHEQEHWALCSLLFANWSVFLQFVTQGLNPLAPGEGTYPPQWCIVRKLFPLGFLKLQSNNNTNIFFQEELVILARLFRKS